MSASSTPTSTPRLWGVMRPTPDGAEAFETCLRARVQGLAGIDFTPDPFDSEADLTEVCRWAERAAEAGLGITVHAGEFSTANLAAALRLPGITRIGHGVYAAAGDELLRAGRRLRGSPSSAASRRT